MLERYQVRTARIADMVVDLASRPAGPPWLAAHHDLIQQRLTDRTAA